MKKIFLSVATSFVLFAGNFFAQNVSAQCNGHCGYCCECGCNDEYPLDGKGYDNIPPVMENLNAGNYSNFAVEVLNLVNAERAKVGAPPLRLANDLQQSAAIRAREIVQLFSHTRPDGSDCFTVIRKKGNTCGENIAAGHGTAAETVEQWMNSQGHRENILNPRYRELGVGYAYEDYSTYHHYWVQLFRG